MGFGDTTISSSAGAEISTTYPSSKWRNGDCKRVGLHQANLGQYWKPGILHEQHPGSGAPRGPDEFLVRIIQLSIVLILVNGTSSYLHSSPLPARVVQQLAESQNENLQHLRVYEMEPSTTPRVALPSRLTTFECQSIEDGGLAGRLIRQNKSTIETLKIGQERKLVERYRQSRVELLDPATQVLPNITTTLPLPGMTNLRQLDLSGLDISPLIPENIESAMFLCQLERIALQSCVGSAIFLENLAETFWFAKAADNPNKCVPSLKHFLFRHEALSNQLKQALSQLLASFSTLETLSLLFENALFLERPSNLINNHGPTLKTLVLECRIQPRENLGLDTSRPFGVGGYSQALWQESIGDITRLCPNLEELGMGFPWNDEIVRLRKTDLPVLRRLKTIHIRNFPESQFLSQLGDYTIKEYATKFVEWIFPGLVGGSRPSLELLALGPTLYETRWKTNPVRRQPPEFLRTHYFALDWAKTRFGRWHPLITGVSERYVEEARSEAPPAGVFEQVWLR